MNNPDKILPVTLDETLCLNCGRCLDACPTGVFQRNPDTGRAQATFAHDCHVCFLCVPDCPAGAISVTWEAPNPRHRSVYDVLGMDFDEWPVLHRARQT